MGRVISQGKRGGAIITYEGPFFEHDPKQTLRQNIHRAVAMLAKEGAEIERDLLAPSANTGETVASVHEKTTIGTLSGVAASLYSQVVIDGPSPDAFARYWFLEGGARRKAAASRVGRKERAFQQAKRDSGSTIRRRAGAVRQARKAAKALRSLIPQITDELSKGLN